MDDSSLPPPKTAVRWPNSWRIAAIACIGVATLAAYLPSLHCGMIWDDDAHVTRPDLRSLHGLSRIWFEMGAATEQYYPLVHTLFWLEYRLWGDWLVGYHLSNIAVHIVAATLVMAIMRELLHARGSPWADAAAFLTAAVFALHPVQVESVAWITELKNTLSTVFYLAAMLAYLRFDETRRGALYRWATAFFIMGLLSKMVTVTLPAALLVILWWKRGWLRWREDILPVLPWFAIGVLGGLFTAWVEHDVVGAQGQAFKLSTVQRLMLSGRMVCFYAAKLIWPAKLILIYPRWSVDARVWWQWLFVLAPIVSLIGAWRLARRNRGLLAGLLFFTGSLFPVLAFFNVNYFLFSFVADHFQYLPSLGIIALIGCLIAAALWRIHSAAARLGLMLTVPALLSVLTFGHARTYADARTLYGATLAVNPMCWMAHYNLGVMFRDEGKSPEAIESFRRALDLYSSFPAAHNNLAAELCKLGRQDEAIASFNEALRLWPGYADAWINLITTLTHAGRPVAAVECAQQAITQCPRDARIRVNYGIALSLTRRPQEAVEQLEEATRLGPDLVEAHADLAIVYDNINRRDDAIAEARRAFKLARGSGQIAAAEKIRGWLESRNQTP